MKLRIALVAIIICLLGFACSQPSPANDTEPMVSAIKTQLIFEGMPGAMKEVGFAKFDDKGHKLAYKYLGTHLRYTYNAQDSLAEVFDLSKAGEENLQQINTYTAKGAHLSEKYYSGPGALSLSVDYSYNADGTLATKISDSKYGGKKTIHYHYQNGKLIKEQRLASDEPTVWVNYSYNEKGQISKADFLTEPENEPNYSETFYYDEKGRLGNKVERSGPAQTVSYNRYWQYDPRGHLVEEHCAPEDHQGCNGKIEYEWNAQGELISKKEFSGEDLILMTEYRWE